MSEFGPCIRRHESACGDCSNAVCLPVWTYSRKVWIRGVSTHSGAQRDLQLALAFPRHKDAMPKRTTLTFTSEDAPKSGEDTLYVYYCKYSGKHALTIGEQPFSTATNARCRTFILTLFPQMRTSPSSRSGEQTGQESRTLTSTM